MYIQKAVIDIRIFSGDIRYFGGFFCGADLAAFFLLRGRRGRFRCRGRFLRCGNITNSRGILRRYNDIAAQIVKGNFIFGGCCTDISCAVTVDVVLLSSWDEAEELTEDCSGEVRSGRVVSVEINVFSDWAEEVRWGIESSGCCVFKPLQAVMVRSREDNNKISAFFFMF